MKTEREKLDGGSVPESFPEKGSCPRTYKELASPKSYPVLKPCVSVHFFTISCGRKERKQMIVASTLIMITYDLFTR